MKKTQSQTRDKGKKQNKTIKQRQNTHVSSPLGINYSVQATICL